MPQLDIATEKKGDELTVALCGKLSVTSVDEFDAQVRELADLEFRKMILDLSELSYISSAGLRSFLQLARLLEKMGRELVLIEPQEMVTEVIKAVGFDSFLKISAKSSQNT